MATIFVSYRRSDAPGQAGRIYDGLAQRFGEENVFKDVDSLEPGVDFAEVIEETIGRCDALIAVIGAGWLDAEDRGSRRLDDPDDWVRMEIVHALERKIRVIPVLVAGASMPGSADLPDDLRALARRNAHPLVETSWKATLTDLLDNLENALARKAARAPAPPETRPRAPAPEPLTAEARSAMPKWEGGAVRTIEHPAHGRRGRGSRAISCMTFSPDGLQLATGATDHTARVWEVESGVEIGWLQHADTVHGVAFSADGQLLATASADDTAALWELGRGEQVWQFGLPHDVDAVRFRPEIGSGGGAVLVSATREVCVVWEAGREEALATVEFGSSLSNRAVEISADGRLIAGASIEVVRVWEVDGGRTLVEVKHPCKLMSIVNAVDISPDGSRVASAGAKTARVWDIATGDERCCVQHRSDVQDVAFSPDGGQIATASFDSTAAVWDAATGEQLASLPHEYLVAGVAFSPDGRWLATASDNAVRLWEARG